MKSGRGLPQSKTSRSLNGFGWLFATILSLALLAGCSKSAADKSVTPEKAEPEKKVGVTLDAETQERLGLKIESPTAMQWQPELKCFGHVLDPAPLNDLLTDLFRAETVFDASHQELERAKQLKQDGNISERVFQETESAYKQNLAAVGTTRQKIETAWGSRIAEMTGPVVVPPGTHRKLDDFLDKIPDRAVLIRVDLPVGERSDNSAQMARIIPLTKPAHSVAAVYFSGLPAIDSQTQQQGVLLAAEQSPATRLTAGEAVTAFLKVAGEPIGGVVVPLGAVLRHEGKGWAYVQSETNQFVRVEIPLDRQTDGGWFVSENISATNHIVVSGAQTILSAELGGGKAD